MHSAGGVVDGRPPRKRRKQQPAEDCAAAVKEPWQQCCVSQVGPPDSRKAVKTGASCVVVGEEPENMASAASFPAIRGVSAEEDAAGWLTRRKAEAHPRQAVPRCSFEASSATRHALRHLPAAANAATECQGALATNDPTAPTTPTTPPPSSGALPDQLPPRLLSPRLAWMASSIICGAAAASSRAGDEESVGPTERLPSWVQLLLGTFKLYIHRDLSLAVALRRLSGLLQQAATAGAPCKRSQRSKSSSKSSSNDTSEVDVNHLTECVTRFCFRLALVLPRLSQREGQRLAALPLQVLLRTDELRGDAAAATQSSRQASSKRRLEDKTCRSCM
ncbi:uncharacterized protein LOC34621367 [Cyclospora cayetanensis]|uniref:Uncharacterized protein LOC34621367 n=1 Tax=Cyclospora cayetanensis TaxID=88456 RepID=A0A6P6RX76_9EIME|nr:uncharacterized protein LOC34621367 [Cyclospora cayetanensis]